MAKLQLIVLYLFPGRKGQYSQRGGGGGGGGGKGRKEGSIAIFPGGKGKKGSIAKFPRRRGGEGGIQQYYQEGRGSGKHSNICRREGEVGNIAIFAGGEGEGGEA